MTFRKGAVGRTAATFLRILFPCLIFSASVHAAAPGRLAPPEWQVENDRVSEDGYIELEWRAADDGIMLFRLSETGDSLDLERYVGGSRALIYR